ncbi:MAG: DUF4935 domain-containing protein [Myxococcales bacterium]|nr:DUF4935 domain-containing protein [Myxococcales bacterium]
MPEIAIKLVVVLDTTVAESARFNFDSGSLGELQTEAQEGSLKIALTEVQAGEMRAHVKEQSDAIRSVAKALRAGAGKKRIASAGGGENDGVGIPRLVGHPAVSTALDAVVEAAKAVEAALESFLAKPYVITIPCGHVQASRLLPAYFGGHSPFGAGRKKDEFPDAISIEAIRDFLLDQGDDVELHVVSEDNDWHGALSKGAHLTVHRSVADVLQYLRNLDQVAELVGVRLRDDPDLLGRVVAKEFPQQGFSLEEDWDASFEAMAVTALMFNDVTVVSLANRRATIQFHASVTFEAVVDFTDYGSSAWDSEEGEYMFRDMYRAHIVHPADVSGSATVLLDANTGQVLEVERVSWDTTAFEVSFDSAESVEQVYRPDPDDYDATEGVPSGGQALADLSFQDTPPQVDGDKAVKDDELALRAEVSPGDKEPDLT